MNEVITADESLLKLIPKRRTESNKGTYKRVLIAAGSCGMSGAAFFAALASYRTGAGLVTILTPESNRQILQILIPEAILCTYTEEEAAGESPEWVCRIKQEIKKAGVVILGPGISTREAAKKLTGLILKEVRVPLVLDADALNILSERSSLREYLGPHVIVTPHPGEMSRMTGISIEEILKDTKAAAEDFRDRYGVTCVLKSHRTVTAASDGRVYINATGTPALAKGGSGDVLTGIIAGLICLGLDNGSAAALGCCIHGLAGRCAALKYGEHGVLARDTADAIGEVMKG